jgi:hypothetical protein
MIKDGVKSDSPLSCVGSRMEENTPYLYHDLYHKTPNLLIYNGLRVK